MKVKIRNLVLLLPLSIALPAVRIISADVAVDRFRSLIGVIIQPTNSTGGFCSKSAPA
jgi:hypothetical protein